MEKLKKKLQENEYIKYFLDLRPKYGSATLIGGAVVDILEDRVPKDFDFLQAETNNSFLQNLLDNGFEFICSTKTADTYRHNKNGMVVQMVKTLIQDFDFKISQAKFKFDSRREYLKIDTASFENKTLIPTGFDSKKRALNSLMRIPHWRKKGYDIHEKTYLSLLGVVGRQYSTES